MPNQTLYDNFSQVRQYIDQEKPDLSSYVTKSELSGCSYATTSQIPVIDENLIPNTNNTYNLGNSSNYYKTSYAKNVYVDNTIKFWQASSGELDIDLNGVTKYFFNPDRFAPSTANNHNKLDLGKSNRSWKTTYTQSLYLNGTDINDTLSTINSTGKLHYGTAVHDRTSYTVTATVDNFETDSNGNPLVGTTICVKLTSVTGTNPSTLYPIKFIVNGKELPRWYANAEVTGNGRNWYRDMNDGVGRYWYWFFDGTYWVWQGISEERDSTYSSMTDAEASAGTSTTGRLIKPVTLATYYTAKSCFSYDSSTGTLTITI